MAIKRVVAMFNVDTGPDGADWDKSCLASMIDGWQSRFNGEPLCDNPDTTVWDSLADFQADIHEGVLDDEVA
jgi:hypothetical protein